jgi:hypothetical protein
VKLCINFDQKEKKNVVTGGYLALLYKHEKETKGNEGKRRETKGNEGKRTYRSHATERNMKTGKVVTNEEKKPPTS